MLKCLFKVMVQVFFLEVVSQTKNHLEFLSKNENVFYSNYTF